MPGALPRPSACEAGKLVPQMDSRRFTLATVDEVYRILRDERAEGRLVVDID